MNVFQASVMALALGDWFVSLDHGYDFLINAIRQDVANSFVCNDLRRNLLRR